MLDFDIELDLGLKIEFPQINIDHLNQYITEHHKLRDNVAYLYRINDIVYNYNNKYGKMTDGLIYRESLHFLEEKYGHHPNRYIQNLMTELDGIRNRGHVARAIYFVPTFAAIRVFQIAEIRSAANITMRQDRTIEGHYPKELMASVKLISRVHRGNLPPGSFYQDLHPQNHPLAVFHLVEAEPADKTYIKPQDIEFWVDGEWKSGIWPSYSNIFDDVEVGNVKDVVPPFLDLLP